MLELIHTEALFVLLKQQNSITDLYVGSPVYRCGLLRAYRPVLYLVALADGIILTSLSLSHRYMYSLSAVPRGINIPLGYREGAPFPFLSPRSLWSTTYTQPNHNSVRARNVYLCWLLENYSEYGLRKKVGLCRMNMLDGRSRGQCKG